MSWNPNPGVRDISVAVIYPGGRLEKMSVPLQTTDMDVAINPDHPYERDIVIADNADYRLGFEVWKNKVTSSTLVYRMRGDVYDVWDFQDVNPVKHELAKWVLTQVDGIIALGEWLADKAHRRTGVPTSMADMWIDPTLFPNATHTDYELRGVTLTNADYIRKIWPILEWAPIVERVLDDVGGEWRVFGDGRHEESLRRGLAGYSHVHFGGFTNTPKQQLAWANVMLHPSNLESQGNAILEGMASGLPVIASDFIAFQELQDRDAPIQLASVGDGLREQLIDVADPANRHSTPGPRYCELNFAPEIVGRQYERFFRRLLSNE
jgi:glycosyltransferase involved in cell wall biosynthesis